MKWGLIPFYSKPGEKVDHFKMFNARSETLHEKPAFRHLLAQKRCVVLFEGFYEWKQQGGKQKQPYYVSLKDKPLFLAGLYDVCPSQGEDGEPLRSCVIITTDSSRSLAWLHDRMPAILPDREAVDTWLSGGKASEPAQLVQQMCHPYNGPDLLCHPVTPAMTSLAYDKPDCAADMRTRKGSITSFFAKAAPKGGSPAPKDDAPSSQPTTSPAGGVGVEQELQGAGGSSSGPPPACSQSDAAHPGVSSTGAKRGRDRNDDDEPSRESMPLVTQSPGKERRVA